MDTVLGLTTPAPLSLSTLSFNILLGLLLSSILAWCYVRYGKSLSNRAQIAQLMPLLTLITVLVISVVKSSLALSLGLVGALSIVRFRTAIKEPEELIYLFMALAVGLGLGADQRWPTLLAVTLFIGYLLIRALTIPQSSKNNLYLNITSPLSEEAFTKINDLLLEHVEAADLRRIDRTPTALQATYLIKCGSDKALLTLMDDLGAHFPECDLSFVEQDNSLGG